MLTASHVFGLSATVSDEPEMYSQNDGVDGSSKAAATSLDVPACEARHVRLPVAAMFTSPLPVSAWAGASRAGSRQHRWYERHMNPSASFNASAPSLPSWTPSPTPCRLESVSAETSSSACTQ